MALRNATDRKEAVQATTMEESLNRRLLAATRDYLADFAEVAPFLDASQGSMDERPLPARSLPCLRHLDRIRSIARDREHDLLHFLADNRHAFHWGQTYTEGDFGANFIDNYGWLELFGTRGHFTDDGVAGGFLILGPHLHYPDHHHVAEEIYVPLTGGAGWRMGDSSYVERAAGEVIHHPSNINHAMMTGPEPLLALYLWRGGPLAARSTVTAEAETR